MNKLAEYRDNQAKIFRLATKKVQTDKDMKKLEALHNKQAELEQDVELCEALEQASYAQ